MFGLNNILATYEGGFGKFFVDYWWMFLLLALAIALLVFVVVWGIKQTNKASKQEQAEEQKTDEQKADEDLENLFAKTVED